MSALSGNDATPRQPQEVQESHDNPTAGSRPRTGRRPCARRTGSRPRSGCFRRTAGSRPRTPGQRPCHRPRTSQTAGLLEADQEQDIAVGLLGADQEEGVAVRGQEAPTETRMEAPYPSDFRKPAENRAYLSWTGGSRLTTWCTPRTAGSWRTRSQPSRGCSGRE